MAGGGDPNFGGCEGPDSMFVKLISSDGHEFIVKREHAFMSATIQAMLSSPTEIAEDVVNQVNLENIPSHILSRVCMFFSYKVRYANQQGDDAPEAPEFVIDEAMALELLQASNFLDC